MDDLISRQAAIDALDSINCFGYIESSWDIVRGIIEHVPSVQPERKTGRWIKKGGMIYCSKCSASFEMYFVNDFAYCPNCGIRMEGTDERLNQQSRRYRASI